MNFKKLIFVFSLFSIIVCGYQSAEASHVAGGSMSYRCLGNSRYEVSLEFRRDCFNAAEDAQFDQFATISIFNSNNQLVTLLGLGGVIRIPFSRDDTLNETISSVCNVIGDDVCVQTTIYRDTLILPERPGGYILAYQRCCRNNTLTNIQDPLMTGSTYWVKITELALQTCNNSPVFDQWPNAFICVNEPLSFNDKATDTDGDSLVYSLCTPSAGAAFGPDQNYPQPANPPPFPEVVFAPGFSESNMMGGSPISIDANTGEITAGPNQVGQFLIGVCVQEFRDGQLLSEIRRDFEYNVRVCGREPIAIFEPSETVKCDGLTISFENQSNSNFLDPEDLEFTWFFDYPNTGPGLTSTERDPVYTFPESGFYTVAMATFDGQCVDTAYVDVAVSRPGDPTANFTLDSYNCNAETIILLDQTSITTRDSVEHIWLVSHSGITDTLYGESHELDIGMDQDISISYEIITDIGCNDIKLLDTTIVTNDFVVEYEDKIICDGESVVIFSSDLPDITVDISPDTNVQFDGAGTYFIDDFIGEQDFTINVTNGFCFDDSIVNITTAADPTFPLPDLIQCGSATVELNADGPDFYFYEWSGPLITDPNEVNPTVSLLTSETYYVTVSTSEGSLCSFQDSLDVIVSPIPQFEILPAPRIIYCSGDTVTLSLDQTFESVEWTSISGELLGEEDTLLLIDLIESDTISALVTTIDGCQNEETVIIQFVAEPIINFAPETIDTVCQGDDAFLAVVPTSDSITWTDIDGVVLGVGNTLIVPNVQDSQTVINVTSTNILYSCETMRSITINLYPDPVIDFTPLDNITICPGMMIPINIESQDSVIWYDENGDVLAIGSELFLSGIEDTITYTITVINEFGCETSKDFEIIVDPSIVPEVDISILDTVNVCETTDFSVTIESMDSITWYDINGNVLEVGNDFMVQNVTDTTTYIISVIDTFGCELLDTFDLNPYAGINLQIITLSNDTVYCEGESVDIISISNVDATVSWFNADTLIGVGDTLMDYFPIGDVSIVAIAEDMFGCMSSDTFDIRESQTEGEIVGDSLICIDGMADLMFIPEIDTDQFSIAWEPNEYITIDNGLSITVGPPFTTLFTAMYSNEDGCITQDSFFVIVAGFFDPIIAEADPPEILLGNSSQLSTDQDDSFTYNWEPVETLDDPESPTPIATPLETTTYFVTVTDLNGCTGTAEVTVEVIQPNCDESDIFIPNMFTPNGDMLNDFFKVESNFVEEQEVIIYNRWGEEVYKSSDINARWDGTFEGRELPPDVFGYHIWIRCINGLEYMKQGNITLNK